MALDTPQDTSPLAQLGNWFQGLGVVGRQGRLGRMLGKGRFTKDLYLPVLIPTILLVAYGLLVVWSASLAIEEASITRQAMGVVLGTLAAALIWRYDVRSLVDMQTALLIIDIVLMVMPRIPGLGVTAKGMTGWVRIPLIGLRFQPSELGKIVTIFLMASSVAQYNGRITRLKDYVKLCATLLVPFMLLLVQPDLGTGLVLLVLGAAIIICGGAKRSWVLVTIALLVLGVALIVYTSTVDGLPHILQSYQLKRLAVFIDPSVDPTGDGSEEFGFVGAVLLLALFAWLIFATLSFAIRVESPFVKLVLVGMIAMWTFQILENVGMCIGIMPITGIPLPFISYGSSSMVTQLMCVGVIQSLWRHRKKSA